MDDIFFAVKLNIRDAYRTLSNALTPDGTGMGSDDPDDNASAFAILYGEEAEQAMLKLKEAMHWRKEAEESIG